MKKAVAIILATVALAALFVAAAEAITVVGTNPLTFTGRSSDPKPTGCVLGSRFVTIDTFQEYIYTSAGWVRRTGALQTTGSLGSLNAVSTALVAVKDNFKVYISGTWSGQVDILASNDGGSTYLSQPVGSFTSNASGWVVECEPGKYYIAKMTSYSSGTAAVVMEQ